MMQDDKALLRVEGLQTFLKSILALEKRVCINYKP